MAKTDRTIDKFGDAWRVLSNFYPTPVVYKGLTYPTVEHAYQALKTTDRETQDFVRGLSTPGQAKRVGKMVDLREDWDDIKLQLMEDLCRIKFTTNEFCKSRLLDTGDAELIEGNTWGDVYWGVCKGVGENHLGKILMKIRQELNEEAGQ